jgi:hypothetical protein
MAGFDPKLTLAERPLSTRCRHLGALSLSLWLMSVVGGKTDILPVAGVIAACPTGRGEPHAP